MGKQIGLFVTLNEFGSTVTDKVKQYETYEEMVHDTNPSRYGIVDNTVYHYNNGEWTVGFYNVNNETDYTAFEVLAHDYIIPVGECTELNGVVSEEIPANMTHAFTVRSFQNTGMQNVVIDWGDGTTTNLSTNIVPEYDVDGKEYDYNVTHTYNANGKYIVKVYGNSYFALKQNTTTNILCRALDFDLPVASHLSNFSSFCRGSMCLLKINIACYNFNRNFRNTSYMFNGCRNLLTATGFSTWGKHDCQYNSMFYNATHMTETDFKLIPNASEPILQVFRGCAELVGDVNDFFTYFNLPVGSNIRFEIVFQGCIKLTGTVPADKLWNNQFVTWTQTKPFTGCSVDIRNQVPESWGGRASDNIIKKSYDERLTALESTIA